VKPASKEIYRAKEFASLAGVTVRALPGMTNTIAKAEPVSRPLNQLQRPQIVKVNHSNNFLRGRINNHHRRDFLLFH
jgi:hypothetical protein